MSYTLTSQAPKSTLCDHSELVCRFVFIIQRKRHFVFWQRVRHFLEARLDLLLGILKSPFAGRLLASGSDRLRGSEALGDNGRVVAKLVLAANFFVGDVLGLLAISAGVDSDDDSATETKVVLQAVLGTGGTAVVGPATEVPDKLSALGDTSGTERVALGDEAARGVDNVLAAVGDVAVADKLVGLSRLREAERVEDDHLVGTEAIVKLDNLDILGSDAGLAHGLLDGKSGHVLADEVDGAAGEEAGGVGGDALSGNKNSLGLEVRAGVEEGLGDKDGSSTTVGGRAALKLGERLKDHGRLRDLLAGVDLLELGVRVVGGVSVVDAGNLGEVIESSAKLLHVFTASIAKHLGGARSSLEASGLSHHGDGRANGVLAVVEEALERARHHLLEADNHDTVGSARGDEGAAHGEAGRAGRAVVVDVVEGDLGHAELVEDALAAGGITVAVASDALVDIVVVDLGIKEGLDTGFEAELGVVDGAAGLDELGHAHAEDVDGRVSFGRHFGRIRKGGMMEMDGD